LSVRHLAGFSCKDDTLEARRTTAETAALRFSAFQKKLANQNAGCIHLYK
jgi:hypothetical protein